MSSTLYFEPVVNNKGNFFGDEFKRALRYYYGDPLAEIVETSDIPFLKGMIVAGSDEVMTDANTLVQLIEKHGEVRIHEKY